MDVLKLRDNMKQELQQIKDIETGIEHLNKVKTVETWVKTEKKDAALQNMVAEQKLRTQRILGNLIKEGQQRGEIAKQEQPHKFNIKELNIKPKTLSEVGITAYESMNFQKISKLPEDIFENEIAQAKAESAWHIELTTSRMLVAARKYEREEIRKKLAKQGQKTINNKKWNIEQANIRTYQTNKQYDFIITDPPYPKEYLKLYEILAKRANEWLTDDGLLITMCGQSYFPQILKSMQKHLTYYWMACYLTPGQPTPLRQRQVNTTWKPLLIFSKNNTKYKGKIFGDVFKSDQNEKDFHKWGQSISGMYSIISQICLPGQTIFDPFCGAGTTGIAALKHGCLFDGIDILEENVNITKGRINNYDNTKT